MSVPISARQDLDRTSRSRPGISLQSLDGVAKGRERGLDPRVESRDRRFQLLDGLQVLTEQEAMMLADAAVQSVRKIASPWRQAADRRGRASLAGSVSPAMIAFRMRRPLIAQDIRDHRRQLDVGFLQHRLDALRMLHDLARQLLARARQVAQLLDRLRRHEARPDQAMRQQVGDPGRVVDVALAAGHALDVRRRWPGSA